MKTAVVFYSLDGNCAFTAKHISSLLNADLVQIHTVDQKKRRGLFKILWGVWQVMRGKMPALLPVDFDATDYDLIIIGTPVWAGSPAPAMKVFLSQTKIEGKKIALYACHAGDKGKTMDILKDTLKDNTVISEKDFDDAVKHAEKTIAQIEEWVKEVVSC